MFILARPIAESLGSALNAEELSALTCTLVYTHAVLSVPLHGSLAVTLIVRWYHSFHPITWLNDCAQEAFDLRQPVQTATGARLRWR